MASDRGHLGTVELLLDSFDDPLVTASAKGYEQIIRLLLGEGAKRSAGGKEFKDALQQVPDKGNMPIVKLHRGYKSRHNR
jgi:hypothetical protein